VDISDLANEPAGAWDILVGDTSVVVDCMEGQQRLGGRVVMVQQQHCLLGSGCLMVAC
jgi:hypothetical protein